MILLFRAAWPDVLRDPHRPSAASVRPRQLGCPVARVEGLGPGKGLGFRVWGLGLGKGLMFRVWGLGPGKGLGIRVWGLRWVQGLGVRFRVKERRQYASEHSKHVLVLLMETTLHDSRIEVAA